MSRCVPQAEQLVTEIVVQPAAAPFEHLILLTPVNSAEGVKLRCPCCGKISVRFDLAGLGQLRTCQTLQCGLQQRVNSFIAGV